MKDEIILYGEKVTKTFGALRAVWEVDFSVRRNEIFGIIGPNGAGKTTLLSMINGTLHVTRGSIHYKGINITNWKPHRIAELGISRTFQIVKPFPGMTLLENVSIGALFGKDKIVNIRKAQERARYVLSRLNLTEKEQAPVETLNVSERKRLELARAMAMDPDLILLDEVMAGSSPADLEKIMELIVELNREGKTILLIEHVMKAIMSISHRIMVLHHGEKIAEDKPENISKNDKVISAYLGSKYVKRSQQNA